ncbi:hypothetical protein CONCODRAFT_79139 [Conidiobolus coronatus NRRL 28638]|uniref:Uncharacterized protein n=1 Tax=Conidiobolus coronatus (strain ATCC 28846 / CBS 209.66 / NRRL 28638) TaxID=796925 RepID=A0A137P460_CONC2|nr:hypothetical protein CONCODRAFT_79139 [Conidiobolus coronatus NRRL 28638]|eukprot:KXN69783.1 hypothetical protein CONCODRAFT_79139 [Conidiobolus coronatus NRRL 28638]
MNNNQSIIDNVSNCGSEDPSYLIEEFEWIPLYDTTLIRNLDVQCPNYHQIIQSQPSTATSTQVTNLVVQETIVMLEVKNTFPQQKLFSLKEITKPLDEFQTLALNLQFEMKQFSRLSLLELGDVREMTEDDYFSLVKVSLIEFYNRLWESQSQTGKESFKSFLKQKPKLPAPSNGADNKSGKTSPTSKRASKRLSATVFANKLMHKLSEKVGRTNSSAGTTPSQSQCTSPKTLSPPLSREPSMKRSNTSRFLKSAVSLGAGHSQAQSSAVQLLFESDEFDIPAFSLKVTTDITLEKLVKAVRNKCILDGHPLPTPNFGFLGFDKFETKINSENLIEYLETDGEHHLLIIPADPSEINLEGSPDATLLTPGIKIKLARSNTTVVAKRPQPRQRGANGSRVLNGLDLSVLVGETPVVPPRRKFTKSPHPDTKGTKLSLQIPAPMDGGAPCESSIPQLSSERSSLEDSSSEKDTPLTPTSSPSTNPIILNFKQKNASEESKTPKAAKRASKFFRSLTMKFDKSKSRSQPSSPTLPTLVRSQTSIPKGSPAKETLVFKNLLEGGALVSNPNNSELIGLQTNGVQHLNISVTINKDLKYQFELDPYQPTYTSVMNRVIYHFSQIGGVPLRILNGMSLVYLSEDGNVEISETKELQKLISDCKSQTNLDLLLVPKTLMNDKKRTAIQWELPPNLYDLGQDLVDGGSQSVIVL